MLFDADGVLINGPKFADHLQNDLHIAPEMTRPFFQGPFKDCLVGKADLKEAIAPFLPGWGWNKPIDEFIKLWFNVEHHLNEPLLVYIKSLREKGIRCYVGTNQEKYRSEYMKEFMELKPLFDGFFASNEIGVCKPEVEFFEFIVDDLKIQKEQILFWDDTQRNIDAATNFGIHAEFYLNFEDFRNKTEHHLL